MGWRTGSRESIRHHEHKSTVLRNLTMACKWRREEEEVVVEVVVVVEAAQQEAIYIYV